jgi:hypothetical protein
MAGLSWTGIGIEHVGYRDGHVLGDRRQWSRSRVLEVSADARWASATGGCDSIDPVGVLAGVRGDPVGVEIRDDPQGASGRRCCLEKLPSNRDPRRLVSVDAPDAPPTARQ